jgi:transcriptional regulator with PAS, ATPase and Fis domain
MDMAMTSVVSSLLPALASVFDEIDHPLLVAERSGRLLYANPDARGLIGTEGQQRAASSTFIGEALDVELEEVLRGLEEGSSSVMVECHCAAGDIPAQVRWLPQSDWLLVQMYPAGAWAGKSQQAGLREEQTCQSARPMKEHAGRAATEGEGPMQEEDPVIREQVGEGLHFLAANPVMKKVRKQVIQISTVNVPVLISGESGVGKEVVARLIHKHCTGRSGPFVKVNCAALPTELLESELFGYEQGAFTGATHPKPGKFELANHGTIFLDEIAEMSTHLQSKLLHILQDGQFSRLGSRRVTQVDVRVIAATNVDVAEAIQQGRFREDLYYRLNVVPCHLPPLRQRIEEIPMLFELFFERYRREFGKDVEEPSTRLMDAAIGYPWPGNIRELENFVKRYVIVGDEEESLRELLNDGATMRPATQPHANGNGSQNLKSLVRGLKDEAEAKAIAEALRQTNWRRKDAARILGISYKALLYKMRQFGFCPSSSDLSHTELM